MKATVKYKNYEGKVRQLTIPVEKKEINYIVRTFIKEARFCGIPVNGMTYITTVKCGRTVYEWYGIAKGAGV